MIKKVILSTMVCIMTMSFLGCSSNKASEEVNIYAAASLNEGLTELKGKYESENKEDLVLSFGGSNALRIQIEEGADADIFISANKDQYDKLSEAGFIDEGQELLNNSLVIITPKDNKAGINTIEDLANKDCKIILANNEVPVGKYSLEVFNKLNGLYGSDYSEKVLAKIVSYESDVKKVLTKIILDEGDVGIVYKSDLYGNEDKLNVIEIPDEYNVKASYWIGKINKSKNTKNRDKVYNYIVENSDTFLKYGYSIPED